MVVGGELPTLTQDELAALDGLEHVVSANRTLNVSYTGDGLTAAEPELPEGMVAGRSARPST